MTETTIRVVWNELHLTGVNGETVRIMPHHIISADDRGENTIIGTEMGINLEVKEPSLPIIRAAKFLLRNQTFRIDANIVFTD